MKIKRLIALLLLITVGLVLLAGCGDNNGGEDKSKDKDEENKSPDPAQDKEPEESEAEGIVGTWVDTYGFEYIYNADGTMNMFDVTKNYTFEDGILTQFGDAFDTVFEITFEDNNTMILTQTDPYPLAPVTYTRKK